MGTRKLKKMEKDKVLEVEVGGIISFTVFQDGKPVALL